MNYEMLVNKDYCFSDEDKLTLVPVKSNYKDNMMLEKEAYHNWLALKNEAFQKGYHIDIESAYRSNAYQAKLIADLILQKGESYTSKALALPGHSEHNTGLALDYCIFKNDKFIIEQELIDTKESAYVTNVAHKYGFIIRYPKGKEDITGYMYEPWHLRYVGKKLAIYLYENRLTLDEYYMKEGKL